MSENLPTPNNTPRIVYYLPNLMNLVMLKLKRQLIEDTITLALICDLKYEKLESSTAWIHNIGNCAQLWDLLDQLQKDTSSKDNIGKLLYEIIEESSIRNYEGQTTKYQTLANELYESFAKTIMSSASGTKIDVGGDVKAAIANIGGTLEVTGDLTVEVSYGSDAHVRQVVDSVETWVEKNKLDFDEVKRHLRDQLELKPIKRSLVVILLILIGFAALVIGVGVVIINQNEIRACLRLPPLPMSGTFKVLVADFNVVDAQGNSSPNAANKGTTINSFIAAELRQINGITVRDGSACGVEGITGASEQAQHDQADTFALAHGADIVIYGKVVDHGSSVDFVPEFRVNPSWASTQPELNEDELFNRPLTLLDPPTESELLSGRITVLRAFIRGIGRFLVGDYEDAEQVFTDSLEAYGQEGNEVFLIMAGNAASRENNCETALEYYTQTLATRPTYARGLLGRGNALFNCAGKIIRESQGNPPVIDLTYQLPPDAKCHDEVALDQIAPLLAMAERCYQEAEASADATPAMDIDVKVPYFVGLLYSWQSDNTPVPQWDVVTDNMQQVIDLYDDSNTERQRRLTTIVVRSYEEMGRALKRTACSDPESVQQAIEYFEEAQKLIANYPDREYVNVRQNYQTIQIDILESDDPCKDN